MAETKHICRDCKYFSADQHEAGWGDCTFDPILPFWADSELGPPFVREKQGENCPCWENRDENRSS